MVNLVKYTMINLKCTIKYTNYKLASVPYIFSEYRKPVQTDVYPKRNCKHFLLVFVYFQETFTAHGVAITSEMATAMDEEYHKYHGELVNFLQHWLAGFQSFETGTANSFAGHKFIEPFRS